MPSSDADSKRIGLEWYQSLLEAIGTVQQQLQPGARHGESISTILNSSLRLTQCSSGMLATVMGGEPCRLTDVVGSSTPRDELLADFDELARRALTDSSQAVAQKNGYAALPLAIGNDVHGVLVLGDTPQPLDEAQVASLQPFTLAAAAVLRQFQEDLSGSQVGAVLDNLAEGLVTVDSRARIAAMNAAAEQVFGYTAEEIVGREVSMLMPEPFDAGDRDMRDLVGYAGELEGRRRDGTAFPMDVSVSQIEVQGRTLYVALTRDITEHKARQRMAELERANTQTLELLVRIDAVTGIANRRHFDEMLRTEIRRAAREQSPLALLLCDIDFFKAFNDRYGHPAGDKALRSVAQAIDGCFQRAGELAARYGGEEFGIVVGGADIEVAARLARTMRERVAELSIPHSASPIADHVTVSIGMASVVPGARFDPVELIDEADRALYRAKGIGRNCIVAASGDSGNSKLRSL